MRKLTALTLSAAIVPALALGAAAGTQDRDDMQADTEERAGEQHAAEQRGGEQQLSSKPAGSFYADDLIGSPVKHRDSDEDIGDVQDLIIGEDGSIVGVVVETGAFLGLGGQHVGLSWDQMEHTMEDDESVLYTDMDEEQLRNSPEFERD